MPSTDPTVRFSGLAASYDRHRPNYPAAALELLTRLVPPPADAVDLGCGTGISARLLAVRGYTVVGIEPNDDMRTQAKAAGGDVVYRAGTATATGLPNQSADLVLVAQAFHWFPTAEALAEIRRMLRPNGWAALMWNDPDSDDPFTAGYRAALLATSSEPHWIATPQSEWGRLLLKSPLFRDGRRDEFAHGQTLDRDGLLGRVASVSFAPTEPKAAAALSTELNRLFDVFQRHGLVELRYRTVLYAARAR